MSCAFTSAPCSNKYSHTSTLLYPAAQSSQTWRDITRKCWRTVVTCTHLQDGGVSSCDLVCRDSLCSLHSQVFQLETDFLSLLPPKAPRRLQQQTNKNNNKTTSTNQEYRIYVPRSKSATSTSPSLTRSRGVCPSRFFLSASAPCYEKNETNTSVESLRHWERWL